MLIDNKSVDTHKPQRQKKGQPLSIVNLMVVVGLVLYTLLFIVGGLLVKLYYDYRMENLRIDNTQQLTPTVWVPTSYADMDTAQIGVKLYADTGLGPVEILDKPINKKAINNFFKAYSAAQAAYYLGNYNKSLEFYALADSYSSKDKTYTFYLDYASAAQTANNNEVFTRQIDAAKKSVSNDKNLSDSEKKDLITTIEKKAS